jgi:ribosomal protein L9
VLSSPIKLDGKHTVTVRLLSDVVANVVVDVRGKKN